MVDFDVIQQQQRAHDRAYFVDHPEAAEYMRPVIFGEFWPMALPRPGTAVVRVIFVSAGSRLRVLVPLQGDTGEILN